MAGFRQEDVELHYEMGEELGRYILLFIPPPTFQVFTNCECLKSFSDVSI